MAKKKKPTETPADPSPVPPKRKYRKRTATDRISVAKRNAKARSIKIPSALVAWKAKFIKALEEFPRPTYAAKLAGITRQAAYNERNRDPEFARLWADAMTIGVDNIEQVAHKLALGGSEGMIRFLLRAHRPQKYDRTKTSNVNIGGQEGNPLEIENLVTVIRITDINSREEAEEFNRRQLAKKIIDEPGENGNAGANGHSMNGTNGKAHKKNGKA